MSSTDQRYCQFEMKTFIEKQSKVDYKSSDSTRGIEGRNQVNNSFLNFTTICDVNDVRFAIRYLGLAAL